MVLIVHGWSDHLGRWEWPAEQLRAAGYTVYLLDLRGHGRSAGRRGHIERFSQYLADIHSFRREVMARHDLPTVLFGHSFGGALVLRYLETDPDLPVKGAVVSNPWLAVAFGIPVWKALLADVLSHYGRTIPFRAGIKPGALSRDLEVGRAFKRDPLVHDRMTPGAWREIQALQRLVVRDAERIQLPILFLVSGHDRIVDREATLELARTLSADVSIQHYPEMFHEIFNDPEKQKPMSDVLEYLKEIG